MTTQKKHAPDEKETRLRRSVTSTKSNYKPKCQIAMNRICYLLFTILLTMPTASCSNNERTDNGKTADADIEEQITRMQPPVRIVCVGNSITEGYGNTTQDKAWPGQLGLLLGKGYTVTNCGVSGTTMFRNSDAPYWNTDRFVKAHDIDPQILIMALGTNDADPWRWNRWKGEFKKDYLDMVETFRRNEKDPIIYVCLPPPLYGTDKKPQNTVVEEELIPLLHEIADEIGAQVIDFHQPLLNAADCFPDNVHPDDNGAARMARIAFEKINEIQSIRPNTRANNGEVIEKAIAVVEKGSSVTFEPTPQDGKWQWTSSNKFSSTQRIVTIENIQRGGIYTAIRTDDKGRRSIANFLISIKGEKTIPITPYVQTMDGQWVRSNTITANPGGNISLGPNIEGQAANGIWTWKGPNDYFAGTREISFQTIIPQQAGQYTATYTDNDGQQSSINFHVSVQGEVICPELISYINYAGWKNVAEMEVKEGDSVTFGPHPSNGNWHWEGPNGFTCDRREATISNFNAQKAGQYIATFTNAAGCHVELIVTLRLKP